MDNRLWTRDLTTDFISLYRTNPCLWKVKDEQYLNKNLKSAAYDALVKFCSGTFPEANKDFVVKKIQSLRGSFRKELEKIRKNAPRSGSSQEDGQEHTPTLWYYDQLLFTVDSESSSRSIDNISEDVKEESGEKSEEENNTINKSLTSDSHLENADTLMPGNQELYPENGQAQKSTGSSFYVPTTSQKRMKRKQQMEETQMQFMQTCAKALESTSASDISEFEAIAIVVKNKLERMDPDQAMLPENIINVVLHKEILKQLSETTIVYNPVSSTASTPSFGCLAVSTQQLTRPLDVPSPVMPYFQSPAYEPDQFTEGSRTYTCL